MTLRKFVFVFVFWPKLISRSAWPFLRQTCTFNELFLRSSILMIWTSVLFSSIWSKTYFDSFWCVYLDSYSFHSLEKNALVLVDSIAAKDFPGDCTVYLTTLAFFLILKEAFSVHDLGQIFTTFTVFFLLLLLLFFFFQIICCNWRFKNPYQLIFKNSIAEPFPKFMDKNSWHFSSAQSFRWGGCCSCQEL